MAPEHVPLLVVSLKRDRISGKSHGKPGDGCTNMIRHHQGRPPSRWLGTSSDDEGTFSISRYSATSCRITTFLRSPISFIIRSAVSCSTVNDPSGQHEWWFMNSWIDHSLSIHHLNTLHVLPIHDRGFDFPGTVY